MTRLVALLAFLAYSEAVSYQALIEEQWQNFKLEYSKIYESESEERYRQNVYMGNLHRINEHNKLYEMNLTSYEVGMNQFGDLREDEFLRFYGSPDSSSLDVEDLTRSMSDFVIFDPPTTVNLTGLSRNMDWRARGAVTPVKNQRMCEACWSFSATGVLEAHWYRKTRKLISLSEQNLLDCSWRYGNQGCHGGRTIWALNYIRENGGVDTERSYRYRGRNSRFCRYKPKKRGAVLSNVVLVPIGENQLLAKVGTIGPMAVSIEMYGNFRFYRKGIFNEPNCRNNLNHAMLVVGYDTQGGRDFWWVKNSWGRGWGERGYVRMTRNRNNQCGIASNVSYPKV